jgi:ribosomal protein S15P/S13E
MGTQPEPSFWEKFQQFFGITPSPKTSENPVDPITQEIRGGLVAMFGGGSITGGNEIANILGGCDCNSSVIGGYDELQSYGDSVYSKQKEKLIRDIASDVFTALKLKGSKFAETAPISDVVAHLKKVTPHPRDRPFNKTFKSSSHNQKEVCHALANAINNRYGSNMVPMSLTEEGMCDRIAEVMYSLFIGLHTEFMTVAGDVVRIVKNLEALKKLIYSSYQKQVELVKSTGEVNAMNQSAETEKLYKALNNELDRQLAILGNMINVAVGPTGTSLISLLSENKDFSGLVKEIKGELGTDRFGDKLAQLLTGISSVAYSAEIIEKALKTLGMSVKDFKDSESAKEFRTEVFKHIQDSSPTSDELDKMMAAAEVIYKNDYSRNELMQYLDKHVASKGKKHKAKGRGETFGGFDVEGGFDIEGGFDVEGGLDDDDDMPLYWSKKSLNTKLKKKNDFRKLMLGEFRRLLQADFRKLILATNGLVSKIGTELDADDNLDRFVQVFKNLPTLNETGLTTVLSGYPRDGISQGKKENFLTHYHSLIYVLEPLVKGRHGNLFLEVRNSAVNVIKTVDDFSDKIVKAITEIHVDRPEDIRDAIKKTSNLFFGSGEGASAHSLRQSFVEFDKVKNSLIYFYNIRNIRQNLSIMSNEMTTFSEDYENMLGEEAAFIINSINKYYVDNAKNYTTKVQKQHMEAERMAKIKMVEVAQAIDLYLKAFSNNIAKNPDVVKNIISMLEQVDMVAKWFTEKSGDNLAAVMESFPNKDSDSDVSGYFNLDYRSLNLPFNQNFTYNDWVEKKTISVGDPSIPIHLNDNNPDEDFKQYEKLIDLIKKSVKGMRALENILSVFASIGNTFGDLDIKSKTFMSPGQIFNALCDYVIISSLSFYERAKGTLITLAPVPDDEDYFKYHDLSNEKLDSKEIINGPRRYKESFAGIDMLFHMTIKSIVCKVFTCVDSYKLFNKFSMNPASYTSLNPLRTILGGAEDTVKIEKDNIELYLRLPLLAEWYREHFGFKLNREKDGTDEWNLSIVPSIDGIWSGLLRIVFEDTEYVENGNYTESQIKKLIEEINSINKHYRAKYKDSSVRKILISFVTEMNRIIGFIQQKHIDEYIKQKDTYLRGVVDAEEDFLDYDILDANDGTRRNPAPSDKFVSSGLIKKIKTKKMQMFYKKINRIRSKIDNEFNMYARGESEFADFNFSMAIRSYRNSVETSASEKDAYKVVLNMMQGANKLINKNADMLIMLHETVIVPLSVLWGIWSLLARFLIITYSHSVKVLDLKFIESLKSFTPDDTSDRIMNNFINKNFPLMSNKMQTAIKTEHDKNLNANNVVKKLLSSILDLCSDANGLITFDISDSGHINLNWNKLENLCTSLLENVKLNIKKLSPYFNSIDFTFDNYTLLNQKETDDSKLYEEYNNSTSFIQRELIDQIFNNIYKFGLPTVKSHIEATISFYGTQRDMEYENGISSHILYERDLTEKEEIANFSNGVIRVNNLQNFPFNILPVIDIDIKDDGFNKFLNKVKYSSDLSIIEDSEDIKRYSNRLIVPKFYGMTTYLDYEQKMFGYKTKSLFNVFNSTLFQFLEQMTDPKIYINLIRDYINTEAFEAVMKGNSFPNIFAYNADDNDMKGFIQHYCPKDSVLYSSNAQILSALYNSINQRTNDKKYVYNNINEIQNSYLIEIMKCNLPYFMKIFQTIHNRARILEKLLDKTKLGTNLKPETVKSSYAYNNYNPTIQKNYMKISERGSETGRYYIKLLKNLMRSCNVLIKSCSNVYKELQDTNPYFLELSKDFIEDFKNRNNNIPLMPASLALLPCNSNFHKLLLPNPNLTSEEFKFNYGSRLLLARSDIQPKLDHIPSAKVIYNNYILTNKNTTTISMKEYEDTILNFIKLTRWLNDSKVYNDLFTIPYLNRIDIDAETQVKSIYDIIIKIARILDISTVILGGTIDGTSADPVTPSHELKRTVTPALSSTTFNPRSKPFIPFPSASASPPFTKTLGRRDFDEITTLVKQLNFVEITNGTMFRELNNLISNLKLRCEDKSRGTNTFVNDLKYYTASIIQKINLYSNKMRSIRRILRPSKKQEYLEERNRRSLTKTPETVNEGDEEEFDFDFELFPEDESRKKSELKPSDVVPADDSKNVDINVKTEEIKEVISAAYGILLASELPENKSVPSESEAPAPKPDEAPAPKPDEAPALEPKVVVTAEDKREAETKIKEIEIKRGYSIELFGQYFTEGMSNAMQGIKTVITDNSQTIMTAGLLAGIAYFGMQVLDEYEVTMPSFDAFTVMTAAAKSTVDNAGHVNEYLKSLRPVLKTPSVKTASIIEKFTGLVPTASNFADCKINFKNKFTQFVPYVNNFESCLINEGQQKRSLIGNIGAVASSVAMKAFSAGSMVASTSSSILYKGLDKFKRLGSGLMNFSLGFNRTTYGGYINYKNIWNDEFNRDNQFSSLCLSVNNLTYVIELIEEGNNNNAKAKLTSFVTINNTMGEINNRKQLRVLNILDMNIVPFDVHSLMKEVPFANLINYSYTFDRLATELILPDWFRYSKADRKKNIISVSDFNEDSIPKMKDNEALLISIIYPHQRHVPSMMVKITNVMSNEKAVGKFGKPAYISDQLFLKVLLEVTTRNESEFGTIVARFQTKLFRNLLWFSQLQRLMKASMVSYLSHVESPVVTGLDIADPIITEYTHEGQKYDERVFQGVRDSLI